jgi:outer membrane protein OmpA-like peptidoglycan-associated protein
MKKCDNDLMLKFSTLLILGCAGLLRAGDEAVGTTAANFLKIAPHARAAAMGEAFTGLSDDETSLIYNPAGTARILQDQISATHIEWFQGIRLEHLGGVFALGPLGSAGAALSWLQVDDLIRTERVANTSNPLANYKETGSFAPHDMALTLGFAHPLTKHINVGSNLNLIQQSIDSSSGYAASLDLGGQWLGLMRGLDIGLVAKNLGTPVSVGSTSFLLPLELSTGLAYRMHYLPLLLTTDLGLPMDNKLQFAVGAEAWIQNILALRAGWRGGYANQITAGAGFRLVSFELDYAWAPFEELGPTHRLTASYSFGAPPLGLEPDRPLIAPLGDMDKRVVFWISSLNQPQRVAQWSLKLLDSAGTVMKKTEGFGPPPTKIPWDGRDNAGRVPPDGLVSASLELTYDLGIKAGSSAKPVELDSTPPKLGFGVEPKIFRPGSQSAILIPARFSLAAQDKHGVAGWSLEVRDSEGQLFRAYSGQGEPPKELVWDGADLNGNPAQSNHTYIARFFARDTLGNKSESEPLAEVVLLKEIHFNMASDALFETGKADVRISAFQQMKVMKAKILEYVSPGGTVEIYGHTDSVPVVTSVYKTNEALSLARAQAVVKFFTTLLGMDASMFKAVGRGDSQPIADNATKEGQEANRRVEIIIRGQTYR